MYDGIEARLTKRLSNNWRGEVIYLWSRLDGNYSGLASSDENGRVSPNVNRLFDSLLMALDQKRSRCTAVSRRIVRTS